MELEFFEEAAAELEEDRSWYRERSESAEAGFLRELDHAIQQVADAPALNGHATLRARADTSFHDIRIRWFISSRTTSSE